MKKLEEVFKRSGVPTYTFVQPLEYNKLLVAMRTHGRGVVVEGPSGIGKTTCVLKIIEDIGLSDKSLILSGRKSEDIELIKELPGMKEIGIVLIDDFHKLDEKSKDSIADFIKRLADEESPSNKVVVMGINKAGDSLINFASDLTGRIDTIQFEANPVEKLEELISKGEVALNLKFNIKKDIALDANGSFHITQMLCHETCLLENILEEKQEQQIINTSIEHIKQKVFENLLGTFFDKAKKLATGPRLRREGRAPYFFLLYWLSQKDDWTLDIDDILREHPEHKGSVSQIVDKGYLEDFLEKNPELNDVIHFESKTKIVSVEDPKFVYFLRNLLWIKFAKQLGFKAISFDSKYDFALSFAGKDRDVAEALYSKLTDSELEVFYDKNEQHRILARNIEDYLAPIYKTEALYVIVLLGPDYPKRIWTKFESEQFKQRFGENAVIPIWFKNAPPGTFDETTRVGGLEFDRDKLLDTQIQEMCGILCKKIQDERVSG